MAQLTLSQRGSMANNGYFQQRIVAALKKTANYWATSAAADNNTANYKRKLFGVAILTGSLPNIQAYCQYFLTQYNNDPAVMDSVLTDELADSELTDSASTPATYDYFAGVVTKDI